MDAAKTSNQHIETTEIYITNCDADIVAYTGVIMGEHFRAIDDTKDIEYQQTAETSNVNIKMLDPDVAIREINKTSNDIFDNIVFGRVGRRKQCGDHPVITSRGGVKQPTPTTRNLSRSDYDTDRDWHARTMRYGEGWAHDPTHSQQKRAKPTHTDPEDDMKVDPAMLTGSTSKTHNPRTDGQFWPSH